jgi:hypothetical protein
MYRTVVYLTLFANYGKSFQNAFVLYGTYVQYNLEPVILTLLLRSLSREWKNKKPLTFSVMAKPVSTLK